MIASTFWKKTIHGMTGCDQFTRVDSSWCSRKLPAVWKNFFGTIGARSVTCWSGIRRPVSAAGEPCSKYARIVGAANSTTVLPSNRPT